jgi:hypothetical protein
MAKDPVFALVTVTAAGSAVQIGILRQSALYEIYYCTEMPYNHVSKHGYTVEAQRSLPSSSFLILNILITCARSYYILAP